MKILRSLIGFIISLVVLGLGWLLIAGVFGIHYACWDLLMSNRLWQLSLGVSLATIVILFWLSAISIGKREHFLSFDSEGGTVSISVAAVNVFLAKLKNEFAGIVDLRADVSASRAGAIEVRLDLSVKAGTHVQQLSQALQQRVRDTMRESLGILDIASVKVNVQDIVSSETSAERRQAQSSDWHASEV